MPDLPSDHPTDLQPAKPAAKPRGGRRPGAGRPAVDQAVGMRRINLMLDEATLAVFRSLGGGSNLSAGARQAARLAAGLGAAPASPAADAPPPQG